MQHVDQHLVNEELGSIDILLLLLLLTILLSLLLKLSLNFSIILDRPITQSTDLPLSSHPRPRSSRGALRGGESTFYFLGLAAESLVDCSDCLGV